MEFSTEAHPAQQEKLDIQWLILMDLSVPAANMAA
jgi:hypothetical protein